MLLYEYCPQVEDGNRRMLPALTRLLGGGESAALRFERTIMRHRRPSYSVVAILELLLVLLHH
jgi:hypothetical protein